ncbi:hypothetical protein [Nocardia grenadensis]|uniref:hypothetical protein n=2 Tax=Nocardia TaxID=1817 RepID=UPI0007A3EA3D|nr:hypothetical protein [Nocardia grenadensis]
MDVPEQLEIYYVGSNGQKFHWSGGENEGNEGIKLAAGSLGTAIEDMFEAPFEAIYQSTAFELGGHYQGMRENMFEFTLAFNTRATADRPWRINWSRFRKAMDGRKDGEIHVKIVGESHRWLKVRLRSQPKLKVNTDPNNMKYGLVLVTFVAAFPRWISEDWTDEAVAETDTTLPETDPQEEIQYVQVSNPTNCEAWIKWTCQAGNANIVYTLPDFSFGDDRFDRKETDADRMVELPALIVGENIVVDTDEMTMAGQVNSSLDTQVYQRMNGREFLYPLPPYTDPINLPVTFQDAQIGNKIQVRVPRTWSTPWGLD